MKGSAQRALSRHVVDKRDLVNLDLYDNEIQQMEVRLVKMKTSELTRNGTEGIHNRLVY